MLTQSAFPIGFQSDTLYTSRSVELATGDRLLVFSDGLYEARSPAGEIWGLERLQATAGALRTSSLTEVLRQTVQRARTWQQHDGFRDDAALLGLEVIG